jgi:polyisoprenyl-phosphate glycosyltransferase
MSAGNWAISFDSGEYACAQDLVNQMISLVVPILNEQENLPEFTRRATDALDTTADKWEIIFVDDGSTDSSSQLIRQFHTDDPRIKLVELSRNFGHQPAVSAGIHHANGDCVILIDGDLQDPPEVIGELVAKWKEGNAVVLAQRHSRQETGLRGLGFRLFYPLMHWVSDLPHGPDAGIFGLMDRAVVREFNKLPERNRFIPGLRTWLGFKTATVLYDRKDRAKGKPRQTLRRLVHYAMDGMISFSNKPLRVATYTGFVVSIAAFVLAIFYIVTFFTKHKEITGFTTTITCVLFLGGVQLICVGILGEYIARIYEEVKQRPLYVVRETIGVE